MNFFTAFLSAAPVAEGLRFTFNLGNFVANLRYMGIGMLVIFVVIGVIILTTLLINWLFSKN